MIRLSWCKSQKSVCWGDSGLLSIGRFLGEDDDTINVLYLYVDHIGSRGSEIDGTGNGILLWRYAMELWDRMLIMLAIGTVSKFNSNIGKRKKQPKIESANTLHLSCLNFA